MSEPQYIAVMGSDEDGEYSASVILEPGETTADALKRMWAKVPGFTAVAASTEPDIVIDNVALSQGPDISEELLARAMEAAERNLNESWRLSVPVTGGNLDPDVVIIEGEFSVPGLARLTGPTKKD